jgi:hypothetical protein
MWQEQFESATMNSSSQLYATQVPKPRVPGGELRLVRNHRFNMPVTQ